MNDSDQLDKSVTEGDSDSRKKKKKAKKSRDDAWRPERPRDPVAMLEALPEQDQQEIQKALHLFSLGQGLPKTLQEAKRRTYHFWDTQPVPKLGDEVTSHGPIEGAKVSVREEPYSLPQGFFWDVLDLTNLAVLRELCALLNENYTGDDDNTIRYDFSPEYLQWVLQPPGWLSQWHCGVRVSTNKKLVGFIAAVPTNVLIHETERRVVRVNFLCVHKKLRLKRMSPVLIRELARRVSQQGLRQAVYTANVVLPTPLGTCRYWHRSLNPRKLMDVNYLQLGQNMTLQRVLKLNRLPEATRTPGLRPMTGPDVPRVHALLREHLCKFRLSPVLSAQEVEHWLLPRERVVYTYVVESDEGVLTAVVSFYSVWSLVMNHPVHSSLAAAHCFYCLATGTDLDDLMEDTLVLAKAKGFDVFTALDVMENKSFLEKLKFSMGDRNLHYYLYNWACPTISPDKIGLVLPC